MIILAIETSCDETSAAIIKDGTEVLSNIISSQVDFHRKYGGIVPEIASRKHVEVVNTVIKEALENAGVEFQDFGAVAVTYGPGLAGALIVGISAAKAISYAMGIPLIGINHLEGHIYANFLQQITNNKLQITNNTKALNSNNQALKFPFICLLVSGGHTMLILVEGHGKYKTLGRTKDDAAGEAFDKVARFLNLGYPGGPIIDKLAKEGNPNAIKFTRPMPDGYDFSFSGIKTAVVNFVRRQAEAVAPGESLGITRDASPITIPPTPPSNVIRITDLVSSFQQAIVDVLVDKSIRAAKEFGCRSIALAGGVAANSRLREELYMKGTGEGIGVIIPPFEYCTDNAAMVGCAGYFKLLHGNASDYKLTAVASLTL